LINMEVKQLVIYRFERNCERGKGGIRMPKYKETKTKKRKRPEKAKE
jgi:hypothetical protein